MKKNYKYLWIFLVILLVVFIFQGILGMPSSEPEITTTVEEVKY